VTTLYLLSNYCSAEKIIKVSHSMDVDEMFSESTSSKHV
jgi:hypothetical protein